MYTESRLKVGKKMLDILFFPELSKDINRCWIKIITLFFQRCGSKIGIILHK